MEEPYIRRLLEPPRQSFFLLGPRGTGKSTWVRHEVTGAHRIDLLDQAVYHTDLARPGQFADELRAVPPGTTVVVDEVQRVPALLNEVHRFNVVGDRRQGEPRSERYRAERLSMAAEPLEPVTRAVRCSSSRRGR